MALNTTSPTQYTGLVVAEATTVATGGSPDGINSLTKIGGLPVAALVEVRGTNGTFLFPRLTSAQIAAILASTTVETCGGMMCYNSTLGSFVGMSGAETSFSSMQQVAIVSLTSTQLLALNATPVALVAATGANTMIVVDRVVLEYNYLTTAYTVPGGSQFTFTIGGVAVATQVAAAGLADQTVNKIIGTAGVLPVTTVSTLTNAALNITNTVGALTNGLGSMTATVWYTVINV